MRYSKKNFEADKKKEMCCGRILTYDHERGYGFIRTENGSDLFLSSYDLMDNEEKHIVIGALVAYRPGIYRARYVARDVMVLERYPSGKQIMLPDGTALWLKGLRLVRRQTKDGKETIVFVTKHGKEYIFTAEDVSSYKEWNTLDSYWKNVKEKLFKL